MKNLKNQKGISLMKLIVIIAIIIVGFILIINLGNKPNGYKLNDSEVTAYINLLNTVEQAWEFTGSTSYLSKNDFATIGKMLKNANHQWFSNSNYITDINTWIASDEILLKGGVSESDLDNFNIISITDYNYYVTVCVKKFGSNYYLTSSDFSTENIMGNSHFGKINIY